MFPVLYWLFRALRVRGGGKGRGEEGPRLKPDQKIHMISKLLGTGMNKEGWGHSSVLRIVWDG